MSVYALEYSNSVWQRLFVQSYYILTFIFCSFKQDSTRSNHSPYSALTKCANLLLTFAFTINPCVLTTRYLLQIEIGNSSDKLQMKWH